MLSTVIRSQLAFTATCLVAVGLVASCSGGTTNSERDDSKERCQTDTSGVVTERLRAVLHDGYAMPDGCELLVVGESLGEVRRGVLLRSDNGGRNLRTIVAFPTALHLWRLSLGESGRVWVAGDTKNGKGLLATVASSGSSETIELIKIPSGLTSVRAVLVQRRSVYIAGTAERDAVVFSSTDTGTTWSEVARVRNVGAAAATFSSIATTGSGLIVAGTDGAKGVLVFRMSDGRVERRSFGRTLSDVASVAVRTPREIIVAGYATRTGMIEDSRGVVLSTKDNGRHWTHVRIKHGRVLDIHFLSRQRGFALSTGQTGTFVLSTKDGGRTWRAMRVLAEKGSDLPPPYLERLVRGSGRFAVGSVLYQIGVP